MRPFPGKAIPLTNAPAVPPADRRHASIFPEEPSVNFILVGFPVSLQGSRVY
jgi:hypothetical protein